MKLKLKTIEIKIITQFRGKKIENVVDVEEIHET